MGATTFYNKTSAKNAQEAFRALKEKAQYLHGHGGYSGTIAEKSDFTMIELPKGMDPGVYANQLIDNQDRRIDDKWGPAGCFDCGPDEKKPGNRVYFFFGWASE